MWKLEQSMQNVCVRVKGIFNTSGYSTQKQIHYGTLNQMRYRRKSRGLIRDCRSELVSRDWVISRRTSVTMSGRRVVKWTTALSNMNEVCYTFDNNIRDSPKTFTTRAWFFSVSPQHTKDTGLSMFPLNTYARSIPVHFLLQTLKLENTGVSLSDPNTYTRGHYFINVSS